MRVRTVGLVLGSCRVAGARRQAYARVFEQFWCRTCAARQTPCVPWGSYRLRPACCGSAGEGVTLGQPGRAEPLTRVLRSRSVAAPAAAATSSMLTESHGTGALAARRTLLMYCP